MCNSAVAIRREEVTVYGPNVVRFDEDIAERAF